VVDLTGASWNPVISWLRRIKGLQSGAWFESTLAVVGSNDGRVYGLDLTSGKKAWEYEAASPVTSSPAVAKGKAVVATADGQVICFG
jgi:outer membrane protein assembly factor BamB